MLRLDVTETDIMYWAFVYFTSHNAIIIIIIIILSNVELTVKQTFGVLNLIDADYLLEHYYI